MLKTNNSMFFLQKFIQNPKQIGSIWPSSRFLANKMLQRVPWNEIDSIAELGSGTGVITREIRSCVSNTIKVFLFEKDELMKSRLQLEFPKFECYNNANHLGNVLHQKGVKQLDIVISGLPFFNFPKEQRETLMDQIQRSLKTGGYFVAFQYSLQMKKHFSKIFHIEKIDFVPLNIPPAFVYICRKK